MMKRLIGSTSNRNTKDDMIDKRPATKFLNEKDTSKNQAQNKDKLFVNDNHNEYEQEDEGDGDGEAEEYDEVDDDEEYDDEEDEDEDEEEDDDEEELEEEEEEEKPNHPISMVQVKYAVSYDYDNQKFRLSQGEKLNLYEKTNQDWWLCSHLNEPQLTFFVPANYVKDLEVMDESKKTKPPPPRPPPPPLKITSQQQSTLDSSKPQIKPRQNNTKQSSNNNEDIYENLSDLTTSLHSLNQKPDSPNKIISDLDDCLNSQEFAFNLPSTTSSNKTETININKKKNSNPSSNEASSTTIGTSTTTTTNQTTISSSATGTTTLDSVPTPEPDYDDEHIYQNIPLNRKPSERVNENERLNRKAQLQRSSDEREESEENLNRRNNENDEDEEEPDDEDEDNELDDDIEIPDGWKVGLSNCKRKFFYNNLNKDRWYLNYDDNGKCYFYNANNESVWKLPKLKNKDDDDEIDDIDENSSHFRRDFDESLSTFNNLHNRLSMRKQVEKPTISSSADTSIAGGANVSSFPSLSSSKDQQQHNLTSSILNTIPTATTINYSHKPPSDLSNNFKCFVLAKNGKRVRKKNSENYKVILISTKIGFVKEGKSNSHPKMEFSLDFKGGKCYKAENLKNKPSITSQTQNSSQLNSNLIINYVNGNNKNKTKTNKDANNNLDAKISKEKFKENAEIMDMIGNKIAFIIETTNGYKILLINESEKLIDDWVNAINSIITQFQSEFSPIYEGPEILHSTKKVSDPDMNKLILSSTNSMMPMQSDSNNKNKKKDDYAALDNSVYLNKTSDNIELTEFDSTAKASQVASKKKYNILKRSESKKKQTSTVEPISYKKRHSESFKIEIRDNKDRNKSDANSPSHMSRINESPDMDNESGSLKTKNFFNFNDSKDSLPTSSEPNTLVIAKKDTRNIIIKTLNAFLKRRPPIDDLKKQGIIKECIFGSNLINLCKKEKRLVPSFVEEIIFVIESKGLDMDGIYRISGNIVEVQKVRHLVDHGKHNFKDFDIHVLCGALKTFFRELEDPLVPNSLHHYFIESMKIADKSKKFSCVHDLIKKMPISHRETLRHVLHHLTKVVNLSKENRMNVQNIALVFGPNIMRSNPINDSSFGFNPNIMTQNMVVEYMLNNFKELFAFQTNSIFTEYSN